MQNPLECQLSKNSYVTLELRKREREENGFLETIPTHVQEPR